MTSPSRHCQSAQPIQPRPTAKPLDPNSARGQAASHGFAVLMAGVVARLRREGRPVPGEDA